jgi:putative transposase
LALAESERQEVLDILHSQRFVDQAPQVIYATLLDEGRYICSARTMYRILAQQNEVRERRHQRRHPHYTKPELIATGHNQVWSWDITKLKGPVKWTYFYLYVILDIFSRLVVGWMLAHRESAELAKRLIRESCEKQGIQPGQLILHADRGSSMKSKPVAFLLADLGVTKTHSRPHVSNDNPFSEAQFKTLKYRPQFPQRFGCLQEARSHCQTFFHWYNTQHLHSGVAMMTPQNVHYGQADIILKHRAETLKMARMKNPIRFKGKPLTLAEVPKAVWINKPSEQGKSVQQQPHVRA